jgi:hypothetical protein
VPSEQGGSYGACKYGRKFLPVKWLAGWPFRLLSASAWQRRIRDFQKLFANVLALKQPSQRRRDVLKPTLDVSGCLELVLGEQLRQGLNRFAKTRSRRVIGQAMHRPVSSLKARGESTSAVAVRPARWRLIAGNRAK